MPITWSTSGPISLSANGNAATITRIGNGNGTSTITATAGGYTDTKKVRVGTPTSTFEIFTYLPLYADCFETDAFYIFRPTLIYNYDVYPPSYQWSYRVNGTIQETIVSSTGEDGIFIFANPGTYDILVRPVNSCGIGSTPSIKTITVQIAPACGGLGFRMAIAPNPAKGNIYVTIDEYANQNKKYQMEKIIFQLYDLNRTNLVKQWTSDSRSNRHRLDIHGIRPGLYILVAKKGKHLQTQKVIIE